jgi:hypothetical protein
VECQLLIFKVFGFHSEYGGMPLLGMEEAPENGKESLHTAHADGMNE